MSQTHFSPLPLCVALLSLALGLWLSAGQPGRAATSEQSQGTTVQVQGTEISWAPNGNCGTQTLPATADFGISPPGGGNLFWPSGGQVSEACVLSNAPWTVSAVATDMTDSNDPNSSIPANDVAIKALGRTEANLQLANLTGADTVPASISSQCDNGQYCSIGSGETIVSAASPSPETSGFLFGYQLTVPGGTPTGTYSGTVTFTASN